MWQPFIQGLRLRGVDEGGPAAGAGAAVAAGQVRLALLTPLPQGRHEAPAGQSIVLEKMSFKYAN